uniref:Uncharacterized protein n=1 Tax=Sphaerodactylus townsendi TaxID=933632 RepID=A0ACB8G8W6_9SAUR
MALIVRLKTVTHLRGKGDRIAKVAFRGVNDDGKYFAHDPKLSPFYDCTIHFQKLMSWMKIGSIAPAFSKQG